MSQCDQQEREVRADWHDFLVRFHDSRSATAELMLQLKEATAGEIEQFSLDIDNVIRDLLIVRSLGSALLKDQKSYVDAVHRACASAALGQASLSLLRLKFVDGHRPTIRILDLLRGSSD